MFIMMVVGGSHCLVVFFFFLFLIEKEMQEFNLWCKLSEQDLKTPIKAVSFIALCPSSCLGLSLFKD